MFQHVSSEINNNQDTNAVILIHGLGRTYKSLYSLACFLAKHGFDCYLYGYEPTKLSIVEHSQNLLIKLTQLINENRHIKFSVVTHSLGGILARDVFNKQAEVVLTAAFDQLF